MRTISRAEWEEKHPDFKTTDEVGQRYVLRLDEKSGATVLEPVSLEDSNPEGGDGE